MQSSRKLTAGIDARLLILLATTVGALSIWGVTAQMQSKDDAPAPEAQRKAATVRASGRGFPHVVLQDGREVSGNGNSGAQPTALAAADFDSDGITDLVTVDQSGTVNLYRGNVREPNPGGPEARQRRSAGLPDPDAFSPTGNSFNLSVAPDFFVTGDFNADGHQDLLAVAKGAAALHLLAGNGKGNFAKDVAISVAGSVTAFATGEIGRPDGQTDVAIAVTNKNGAQLLVFEHPESAFKHPPEVINLPAAASEIAIGNLDDDFYTDVAVGSGSELTIVQGRGQAYPWDLIPTSGIKRPAAVVATRKLSFTISALAVGRFGNQRGQSLAVLGGDGNIYRFQPTRAQGPANYKLAANAKGSMTKSPFVPTDANARNLGIFSPPKLSAQEAESLGSPFVDRSQRAVNKLEENLQKRQAEAAAKYKSLGAKGVAELTLAGKTLGEEQRARARVAFLRTISGRPSTLANWKMETLVAGSQFASASASSNSTKMLRVNVSDSNLDDVLVLDSLGNQIQLVSQLSVASSRSPEVNGQRTADNAQIAVTSLATSGSPLAILPLRLNMDALSDLVVLSQGSALPSVVMSAPSITLLVTSIDDTGDCQPGNPCSLRNAIQYANSHGGVETINFDLGGAATITPAQELPIITEAVNIFGSVPLNGQPDIEISGANVPAPANGLLIRTSDVFIFGLAINGFKSVLSGQSQIGGNGIAIDSTSGSPNNGNNTILLTFLGTDRTGSLDKGNDAAGLNIFDSDNNQIIENVISGNGSQEKRGAGIAVTGGNSNLFQNNIVGLNALGNGKLGNSQGVFLTGANNVFGGDGAGEGNTVSGNGEISVLTPSQCIGNGIFIPLLVNLDTLELATSGNRISGNRVGTNPAGSVGLGNCWRGIETTPLSTTSIGSITENGRNTVSDNGYDALWCGDPTVGDSTDFGFCSIAGNNVGTDISGTSSLFNDKRNIPSGLGAQSAVVFIANNFTFSYVGGPGGTTPGGACTGFCNLISGNDASPNINSGSGLEAAGIGLVGIFNNYIGTTKSGNQALANLLAVDLAGSTIPNSAPTFFLGGYGLQDGMPVSLGNLISGNTNGTVVGVGLNGNYFVLGNKIGTDASGTFALPNVGGEALTIQTGFGWGTVQIGDSNPLGRNIISGNGSNGIGIYFGVNTKIYNNLIGVNSSLSPLPNAGSGINIGGLFGAGVVVGGGEPGNANVIANNGKSGIKVNNADAFYNNLRGNSIYDNGALGIDLGSNGYFGDGDGVTENDCQDADSGPNDLQNFPELLAPTQNGDGTLSISGALRSRPADSYVVDFYANNAAPAEGEIYLGSVNVETDTNGYVQFQFTSATPVSTSLAITGTATDAFGNTSEFSAAAGSLANFSELAVNGSFSCLVPIVVNISYGDIDADGTDANPEDGICDVAPEKPGPQCSLRAAIEEANERPGMNSIFFNIPGGGVHTIKPSDPLPPITQPVFILGSTQPGYSDTPLIKLDGEFEDTAAGLDFQAGNSTVQALTIVRFKTGIRLNGFGESKVASCFIGLNSDGTTAPAERQQYGIEITNGSSKNKIGGVLDSDRNIISNNLTGVMIASGSTRNLLLSNRLGLGLSAQDYLPNDYGIIIDGSTYNEIGDELEGSPNNISGNNFAGIVLENSSAYNTIGGNYIYGNQANGIEVISGAHNNFIGGLTSETGNLIGSHTVTDESAGIFIVSTAGASNRILNNRIGAIDETTAAPNTRGIRIQASNQFVGLNAFGVSAPNLIGRNVKTGILVDGRTNYVEKVTIHGNNIGTDGTHNLGNRNGVALEGEVSLCTISNNVISGNQEYGVSINLGYVNKVIANKIGTSADGMSHINNGIGGIYLKGNDNTIGGNSAADGNVISGNAVDGISVDTGSKGNTISKNFIGTTGDGANPLQNGGNGIYLMGRLSKVLGNTISGNAKIGVRIERGPDDPANGLQNIVDANLIGTNSTGDTALPNLTGILLTTEAISNTISHNVISGNSQNGLSIRRSAILNLVANNLIGTTKDGMDPIGNVLSGISIEGSSNQIAFNVISGNNVGVEIAKTAGASITDALFNSLTGNRIGTNKPGTEAIPNTTEGVEVTAGANNNYIGGLNESEGNLISGNGGRGIYIHAIDGSGSVEPFGNSIRNNFIGLNAAHDEAIPNGRSGIAIKNSGNNTIGGSATNGNVICGNLLFGIVVLDNPSVGNRVSYNHVGVTRAGLAIGNHPDAINIDGAPQTIVATNNICGNSGSGIVASNLNSGQPRGTSAAGGSEPSITISSNHIGVFKQSNGETIVIANGDNGIKLTNVSGALIGQLNGDPGDPVQNIIGGNVNYGILIQGEDSHDNTINNSFIGTDENGTRDIGNGTAGIKIVDASNTLIGDPGGNSFRRNIISGNSGAGVEISGSSATANKIHQNFFGLAPNGNYGPGNLGNGVLITAGANSNEVGGQGDDKGNLIIASGGAGVRIDETAGQGNLVDRNPIFDNQGLGIDIGILGHTLNDAGDADTGANSLQNYPEFVSASIVGGNLVLQYKVDSHPANSNYGPDGLYLEFFKADDGLEGQIYIGSTHYTAASYSAGTPGIATLVLPNAAGLGIQVGDKLVATATDADGNTSEFTGTNVGTVTGPTAATAIIEGQIITSDGAPLAGVAIALSGTQTRRAITDIDGRYRFAEVETTGFYSVAPSRANFTFAPASRSFSALGNRTDAAFTAVADATQTENPLDTPEYFVRQHYLDFLGREPDESGFNFWSDQLLACGSDDACLERRRVNVSAAYFLSIEFQRTGGLVDRLYHASYARRPLYTEFMPDTKALAHNVIVGRSGWQQQLETNQVAFIQQWTQRPAFRSAYDSLTNDGYVDALLAHTQVSFAQTEREVLLSGLESGTLTRAGVLQRIATDERFVRTRFNEAFVMMEYFGYLRRDPDESGYQFWLAKLNEFNGNFEQAEMVKAFIVSGEYRQRFSR